MTPGMRHQWCVFQRGLRGQHHRHRLSVPVHGKAAAGPDSVPDIPPAVPWAQQDPSLSPSGTHREPSGWDPGGWTDLGSL